MNRLLRLALVCVAPMLVFTPSAQAATKIKLMYTAVAPYMAAYVAKDQGFFEKRGLDVELILAANGSVIVASILADAVQIGTPSPTVFLQAADGGADQVALASTNVIPDVTKSGVLARTDSNIKTPQDLVGKRIGVPGLGGLLDVLFRKSIADQGIDTKKLTYVETSFPAMSDILKAGNIDAVLAVDPFYSRIISQNTGYLVDDFTKRVPPNTIGSVYSATQKWVNANPGVAKAFQEALVEAVAYAKANEASARESLAKYTKLPPAIVAGMAIPNLTAKISAEQIQFWIDTMKARDLLTGNLDAKKLFVPWQAGN